MGFREQMPQCAAWIDALRVEFGAAAFDETMKRGMRGEPGFWAKEGDVEIGTRMAEPQAAITAAHMVIVRKVDAVKGQR